jgi:CubicO group peptidase (beta-lactamase class C family)
MTNNDKVVSRRMLSLPVMGWGLSFALLLCACAGAPPKPSNIARGDYQPAIQYLSDVIKRDMAKHDVKGLSIALVDDQKLVWAEGFGYADVANQVPASADTAYRIGSVSKLFTATEIMRLAEQGKVELDREVTAYVPEFSIHNRFPDSKPITLRALLAHHSGLPTDVLKGMWVDHPVSLAEYVKALREESLASPPQSLYKYSNIDFSLLGKTIENVEHQEFASAMQQNLLTPLGMAGSSFELTPEIGRRYARAYRQGREAPRLSLRDAPAGGMLSSVNDMSHWLRFIFADGKVGGAPLVKPETLREMFKPQFAGLATDFGHKTGMAWMLSGLSVPGGQELAWHNGAFPPYQAHLSLLPEQKLGVIILANSDEASQFITQLGTRVLELASQTKSGAPPSPDSPQKAPAAVKMAHDKLAGYAGHYAMFNQLGSITVDGDQLKTSLFDRSFTLQPIGADTFMPKASVAFGLISIPIDMLSLRFQTVQDRDVAVLYGLPAPFAFERIAPADLSAAWRNRIGKYESTDTGDEQFDFKHAELATESGILFFKALLTPKNGADRETRVKLALQAVSDHQAVVAGIGNGEGGVVRATDSGRGTELVYSGFRFTRIGNR